MVHIAWIIEIFCIQMAVHILHVYCTYICTKHLNYSFSALHTPAPCLSTTVKYEQDVSDNYSDQLVTIKS